MSVRCIRCGTPIQGTAQFCEECAALKAEEEAHFRTTLAQPPGAYQPALAQSAVSGAARACPACGQTVPAGAAFCPVCGRAMGGSGAFEYAGFWMRLLAWIIDGIILSVAQVTIRLLVGAPLAAISLNLIVGFVYHIGFWVTEGATPGKMALGIKIVSTDGGAISAGQAIGRYFAYILDVITLGIGFLMIAFTPPETRSARLPGGNDSN